MPLTPGARLGVYEITAPLGAGGMGQVFRATDTRLKRQVAIKVLPPSLAADADRLARFQREAEVLASLNHPNIAGIYGLEESGGVTALVMELVDGDDLSQRIARGADASRRRLADRAADRAGPRSRARAGDHSPRSEAREHQGARRRRREGARLRSRQSRGPGRVVVRDVANSPTLTAHATAIGMILGTAAYMAPEQAKGKAVDKRADIWAFGVVLYEMLTGRAAFAGDTVTDIIAAVVTREPDWTLLPAATPAAIRRLLTRCLEKDPKRRLRDIGDARFEIDETIARGSSDAGAAESTGSGLRGSRLRSGARVDSAGGRRRRICWPLDWRGRACGRARARPNRAR